MAKTLVLRGDPQLLYLTRQTKQHQFSSQLSLCIEHISRNLFSSNPLQVNKKKASNLIMVKVTKWLQGYIKMHRGAKGVGEIKG